jgi:hypothetical protein
MIGAEAVEIDNFPSEKAGDATARELQGYAPDGSAQFQPIA